MNVPPHRRMRLLAVFVMLALLIGGRAWAQTDEIQVYNAEINAPGRASLTLHNNYTPIGRRNPDFPHGLQPQGTLNGVPEWAYGVADWFEAGLYLPLYSYATSTGQFMLNGFKLRGLFVEPNVDQHRFIYGINFEFSYNARHWDPRRYTSEIRPIIGERFGPVDVIVNPILDNSYYGGIRGLDFAPAERVDYNFSKTWAVALEHYADYGQLRHFVSGQNQVHELFAVVDYAGEPMDVEAGVGHGFTAASDDLVMKLILTRAF